MKFKLHKKLIAALLGVLVLVSSNGVAISLHYCGDKVKDVAFFGQAETCVSNDTRSGCSGSNQCSSEGPSVRKKSCCSDQAVFSKLGIENSVSINDDVKPLGCISGILPEKNLIDPIANSHALNRVGSSFPTGPPSGLVAIRVLYQIFRI